MNNYRLNHRFKRLMDCTYFLKLEYKPYNQKKRETDKESFQHRLTQYKIDKLL